MPAQERRVRSLQIAFHNARGLRNSRNELEIFADDHELDALLVSETNLNAGIADPKIRGYELYRSDRPHGPGGGTAIYVRRTLPHYQIALPVLQNLEATAVRIETVNGPLTIISCYHPPQILLRENDITEILEIPAPRSSPRVTSTASTRSGAVEGPTATVEFYSSSRTTQTC
jgi:hypothetical protein